MEFDTDMLEWLVQTVRGLNEGGTSLSVSYGTYHFGNIPIMFDGEPTEFMIGESEHSEEIVIYHKATDA